MMLSQIEKYVIILQFFNFFLGYLLCKGWFRFNIEDEETSFQVNRLAGK